MLDGCIIAALKGQTGNFGKDLTPDIIDKGVDSPHKFFLLLICKKTFTLVSIILP